jgi:hypothetical protein
MIRRGGRVTILFSTAETIPQGFVGMGMTQVRECNKPKPREPLFSWKSRGIQAETLSLLAYNLGNLGRRLALPQRIENWSLASLQQRLVRLVVMGFWKLPLECPTRFS